MSPGDIAIIVIIVIGLIFAGLYFLNKWAVKKSGEQQSMIEHSKTQATIYVIDKKRDKAVNVNLPKVVMENLPKAYKLMKMNFVKAKIGPQIVTLMCDKKIFTAIPVKKNVKVELAGIYIVTLKGFKTEEEKKQIAKEKLKEQKRIEQAQKLAEQKSKRKLGL